jgi:orotidine-5'-phosphate decarboxylase
MAVELFADRLAEAVGRLNAPCAVGLDPRIDNLPQFTRKPSIAGSALEPTAAAIVEWGAAVIEAVAPIVPVVKPQSAFYERLGADGYRALEQTIRLAQAAGLLVLLDVKRADIGSTAEAYAETVFSDGLLGADAATVLHYFGDEGLQPFLRYLKRGKGVFVIAHTSNPSAAETQDLLTANGAPYYRLVCELAKRWGAGHIGTSGYSSVGVVMGGTYPEQIGDMRKAFPAMPFLIPGYGQQGATREHVAAGLTKTPGGALVSASRSIYRLSSEQAVLDRDEFISIVRGRSTAMVQDVVAVAA